VASTSFNGVWIAAVAPRRENGHEIDLSAALDVIDFAENTPAQGISILGSTGEFVHYDFEDRQRYLQFVLKRLRKPALPSVAHSNIDGCLRLAQIAADHGAAGVLVMPPYYFRYDAPAIRRFYLEFADELEDAAPIFLYNIPFFSSPLPVELAVELLGTGRFAGIKDSSGDAAYYQRLLDYRRTSGQAFTIIIGNDVVYTTGRQAGADGVISGVAGAFPELVCALEAAIRAKDAAQINRLEARLQECIAWLNKYPVPMALKRALRLRGVATGPDALPMGAAFAPFDAWFPGFLASVQQESGLALSAA
jgi:dihydrodipicolinate synthase/N-acetylneuraminate lyase